MAINFSEKQLTFAKKKFYGDLYFVDENLNFLKKLINKILEILFVTKISLINFKRYVFRNFIKIVNANDSTFKFEINSNTREIKTFSNFLKENNYVFIKDFINNDSYSKLITAWPSINFFTHRYKIIKYYSNGFTVGKNCSLVSKKNLNKHSTLKSFYSFIQSKKFQNFINLLLKFENLNFYNYSIGSTMAGNNSFLIPHIDGVMNKEQCCYNFIYFVDGNEKNVEYSGATGIYADNDFNNCLFEPDTLRNSLLIYKSTFSFFHGFKLAKMPKNVFRKTINFQFFSNKVN